MHKHLRHVFLFIAAIVMLWLLGTRLSVWAFVAVFLTCLVAVEGGLWLLHRRDRTQASGPGFGTKGT